METPRRGAEKGHERRARADLSLPVVFMNVVRRRIDQVERGGGRVEENSARVFPGARNNERSLGTGEKLGRITTGVGRWRVGRE